MVQMIDKAEEEWLSRLVERQKCLNTARAFDKQRRSKWLSGKTLVEVIHHSAQPRDSQCLYGIAAWDEYVYA